MNLDGVKTIHDLHIWSLTMGTTALSVHIAIGKPPNLGRNDEGGIGLMGGGLWCRSHF